MKALPDVTGALPQHQQGLRASSAIGIGHRPRFFSVEKRSPVRDWAPAPVEKGHVETPACQAYIRHFYVFINAEMSLM